MGAKTLLGFVAICLFLPAIGIEAHGSCPFSADHTHAPHDHPHHHAHDHDHDHHHDHDHGHHHSQFSHAHLDHHDEERDHGDHAHEEHASSSSSLSRPFKLPEEIAEEEELALYGFGSNQLEDQHQKTHRGLSTAGLWIRAMGSSLLVSMASLICLMLLPFILSHGKPSQHVVDALAAFGAGAMLGDAFLHQLPHAFGSSGGHALHQHGHGHGHDHDHSHSHLHETTHAGAHGHSHSIEDLSVGLAVLLGIFAFFIVEKIVRKAEELSTSRRALLFGHKHHHQHYPKIACDSKIKPSDQKEKKDDIIAKRDDNSEPTDESADKSSTTSTEKLGDTDLVFRRKKSSSKEDESSLKSNPNASNNANSGISSGEDGSANLVLGYLNLFSDGVHNFTDGMALGTAFLHHGSIGGWSRTLFLLAHELPQEVGDFGILVRSGFGVFKALAFNFLSALVALAGTAMALILGGNPGHSSLIEGFTAGGFIYIAVAGVLPEMHQQANSLKQSLSQLTSLGLGVGVAILISLAE